MSDDTATSLLRPAVGRKKVIADFDGGRLTSDAGVMLLAAAERRLGIADRLAGLIADPRNPLFVTYSVADIRQHWPSTRLTIRGDGHYGRPEVMA